MTKIRALTALIWVVVTLAGCGSTSRSIPLSATSLPTVIPSPTPPALRDYRSLMAQTVHTICLDVSQVELRGIMAETALEYPAQALAANRFAVVDPGEACDATLVIQGSFAGVMKSYRDGYGAFASSIRCYGVATASITWEMTFSDNGLPPLALNIEVIYDPSTIGNCYTHEEGAPLWMAWIKAVATNLERMGFSTEVSGWTVPPVDGYSVLTTATPEATSLPLQPTPALVGAPQIRAAANLNITIEGAGDINSEVILIENQGFLLDLAGWQILEPAGKTFTFPEYQLNRGSAVRIFSRAGDTTPGVLYWGSSETLWPPGSTLIIQDETGWPQGRIVVGQ